MAAFDNSYSRLVAWLKIVLPLTALAILSTLFLFSRPIDPAGRLPLASLDVARIAREERIGGPSFSGVIGDGTAVTISAETARPIAGEARGIAADNLRAVLQAPDGLRVEIAAASGRYLGATRRAELRGGVRLSASSGYVAQTDSLMADVAGRRLESGGAVTARGPLGRLSAGKLVLRQHSAAAQGGGYELIFLDGVNLVYLPPK